MFLHSSPPSLSFKIKPAIKNGPGCNYSFSSGAWNQPAFERWLFLHAPIRTQICLWYPLFFCNSDSISLAVYTVSRSCAFSAWLSCTNSQSAKWTPPAAHYWSSWEWGLLSKKLIISCTFPPIFILFFKKMSATGKLTEQWEWGWEELSPHFFPIFNLIWITSNVLCSYKKSKWTNY